MITEHELLEAIAECQGQRNPNANTCMKLASYYTILDHINDGGKSEEQPVEPMYSFANETENTVRYQSGTEFADAIYGRDVDEVMSIMDELMSTLYVVNQPLYNSVMRRVVE